MSLADRVANADPAGQFSYLKAPGTYRLQILGRKDDGTGGVRDEAGKFKGVPAFIVSLLIVESNNPERPVGMEVSWYQGSDKTGFDGRIRAFFNTLEPELAKATPAQFAEVYEAAVGPTQVLAGRYIRAQVTKTAARLSGREIDAVAWLPDTPEK